MPPKSIAVLVVAAGKGERVGVDGGTDPKQYRPLGGFPVLARSLQAFLDLPMVSQIVPVIHAEHGERFSALGLRHDKLLSPVLGGATRQASVLEGLKALGPRQPEIVLIHDAARPLIGAALVEDVVNALASADAVVPTLPVTDTIKRSVDGQTVATTEDRSKLFAAQTPQGFRFGKILSAHLRAATIRRDFTDDAEIAEWAGLRVAMVQGSTDNIKITHPGDFARLASMIEGSRPMETRIGTGFDVHPFEPGDAVWLGGVRIPHKARLKGHSDADVALHALTDAILGAIGEGDIGVHFPPSDMQWRGAASTIFLRHAANLVEQRGGRIVNLDVTIVCEAPRIADHVGAMQDAIAKTIGISSTRIAIKATTSEKLGFTGREEGIVAMASASIEVPRVD